MKSSSTLPLAKTFKRFAFMTNLVFHMSFHHFKSIILLTTKGLHVKHIHAYLYFQVKQN